MRLILITDWRVPDCLERVAAAAAVDERVAIQHRHHGVPRAQFVEEAKRLRDVAPGLFINSDVDLARELGCGLHLPEHLPLPEDFAGPLTRAMHVDAGAGAMNRAPTPGGPATRTSFDAPYGAATEPYDAATTLQPPPVGARFIAPALVTLISPVFTPLSKPEDRPPLGVERFFALAATLPGPAFALGGITVERLRDFKPAGVAVIGAVLHAPDAARATEALLRALE